MNQFLLKILALVLCLQIVGCGGGGTRHLGNLFESRQPNTGKTEPPVFVTTKSVT